MYEVAATCCQPISGPELLGIAIVDSLDEAKEWINDRKNEWLALRALTEHDLDYDPIDIEGNIELSAFDNEAIFIGAMKEIRP